MLYIDLISIVTLFAYFGFGLWAAFSVFLEGHSHIYAENGLIENLQAGMLAFACVFYLLTAFFSKRSDKLIILFCALLCYGFVLREVDVERFDVPSWILFVGSGWGRNAILTLVFFVIISCAVWRDFYFYKNASIAFVKSRPGVLWLVGGVFLLVGDFFEKHNAITHHVFFEEMAELLGCVFILLSSIAIQHDLNNSFANRSTK